MARRKDYQPPPKKKPGPPETEYDEEIGNEICAALAVSTLGIERLCDQYKHWPKKEVIRKWRFNNPRFADKYREAKRFQAELMAEDVIDIADNGTNDTQLDANGKVITNQDVIQRSKLRVDARKWVASRLLPKIYGDSLKVDNNPVDDAMVKVNALVAKKRASKKRDY